MFQIWPLQCYATYVSSKPPSPSAPPRPVLPLRARDAELDAVSQRLRAGGGLVVLVGTGGVGKSRLAVAVAHRWQQADPGARVVWVELQSARTTDDLRLVVAGAVGAPNAETLPGRLKDLSRALLVLDNLEQLPDEAIEVVAAWVREAPSLRVLGTSRRLLHVAEAEHVAVAPLPLPDEADVFDDPAWAILQDCAGRPLQASAQQAVRLLQILDGLPLALSLAAARLEVLTESALLERLREPLTVLVDPSRPHARHGSLTQMLAWSWSLLSDPDRETLARLAVFRGPFDLAFAEALLPDEPTLLDRIQRGVRAHLLLREGDRFRWLVPVRAYARELLGSEGWKQAVRRHAGMFDAWLTPRRFRSAVPEVELVHAELRALLDRAPILLSEFASTLQSAALVLSRYLLLRLGVDEMVSVVQHALSLDPEATEPSEVRDVLRCLEGYWHQSHKRFDGALQAFEAVLQTAEITSRGYALALEGRATCAMLTDDLPRAADLLQPMLDAEGASISRRLRARALLAETLAHLGKREDSELHLAQLQAEAASLSPNRVLLTALTAAGGAAVKNGDVAQGIELFSAAMDMARALQSPLDVAILGGRLGRTRIVLGDVSAGLSELEASIEDLHGLGHHGQAHSYAIDRARTLGIQGRWEEVLEALVDVEEHVPHRRWDLQSLLRLAHACLELPPPKVAEGHVSDVFDALVEGLAHRGGAARDALARVRHALADSGFASEWVKLAQTGMRVLEERAATWRVAADGAWFCAPEGPPVDLSRHKANARVLARLVHDRMEEPGRAADVATLFAAGWPGERVNDKSAANRVHVALSSLRKLGLAPLLDRDRAGWRLREDVPVFLVRR